MKKIRASLFAILTIAAGGFAPSAHAEVSYFNLEWSAVNPGSEASATGIIGLDMDLMPRPVNAFIADMPDWVVSFTVTVSGAGTGNGTFTRNLVNHFYLNTDQGDLDFTQELVGQAIQDGLIVGGIWGVNAGSFTFAIEAPYAPWATGDFSFRQKDPAGGSTGDELVLRSFTPVAVPEPATAMILIGGVAMLALTRRRSLRA